MTTSLKSHQLTLNGKSVQTGPIADDLPMIDFLHEYQNLTGTHLGCGIGICHACVVILDKPDGSSEEVRSCITPASFFAGKKVRTIESHSEHDPQGKVIKINLVQQKFLEHFSFQCGYCTPGFVNASTILMEKLQKSPIPKTKVEDTVSEALQSHICRCTGYVRYHQAVKDAILSTPGLTT